MKEYSTYLKDNRNTTSRNIEKRQLSQSSNTVFIQDNRNIAVSTKQLIGNSTIQRRLILKNSSTRGEGIKINNFAQLEDNHLLNTMYELSKADRKVQGKGEKKERFIQDHKKKIDAIIGDILASDMPYEVDGNKQFVELVHSFLNSPKGQYREVSTNSTLLSDILSTKRAFPIDTIIDIEKRSHTIPGFHNELCIGLKILQQNPTWCVQFGGTNEFEIKAALFKCKGYDPENDKQKLKSMFMPSVAPVKGQIGADLVIWKPESIGESGEFGAEFIQIKKCEASDTIDKNLREAISQIQGKFAKPSDTYKPGAYAENPLVGPHYKGIIVLKVPSIPDIEKLKSLVSEKMKLKHAEMQSYNLIHRIEIYDESNHKTHIWEGDSAYKSQPGVGNYNVVDRIEYTNEIITYINDYLSQSPDIVDWKGFYKRVLSKSIINFSKEEQELIIESINNVFRYSIPYLHLADII